jgi:hypothetical protein
LFISSKIVQINENLTVFISAHLKQQSHQDVDSTEMPDSINPGKKSEGSRPGVSNQKNKKFLAVAGLL